MKITIDIEATAQEMREFLGLPNIQSLQDDMIQVIRDNMKKGVTGFDALNLMKPLFPAPMQAMETMQKAFWNAFSPTDTMATDRKDVKDKGAAEKQRSGGGGS
jgi:hypothetical protein